MSGMINTTTMIPDAGGLIASPAVGYIATIVSCAAFGFMFAPLRKFDCRDGFFVQWVECAVVFMFGFCINAIRDFPKFNLIACFGGFLYATGNVASVPIVDAVGIGLGMLIWGSIQVTVGWCVARFGLFGTTAQDVQNNAMNIAGLVLTLVSGVMFVFVKHDSKNTDVVKPVGATSTQEEREPIVTKKKAFFLGLAVFLGIFHGLMLTPLEYIQKNDPNASKNVLDYVFSYFSSVFFFSTVYFIAYCIFKKNRPYARAELILPSVGYGVLWSIGMTLFFISNHALLQVVSFPITTRLPAIIGAVTDVFLYRTITGKRNLFILTLAITIGVTGVVLVALSNQEL
uniref:Transmembrane protein 144 n=1 Tax=Steinernema glaseri TaxID=37863 RepID=A0A1I7Y8K1_9BILA